MSYFDLLFTPRTKSFRVVFALFFVLFGLLAWLWPHLPTQDFMGYFRFADQRTLLGIPNTLDVLSNIGFLFAGLWASLKVAGSQMPSSYRFVGYWMALCCVLTAFGSTYFHLSPGIETVFWDRLPITAAFCSVIALLIMDRVDEKFGTLLSLIAIPLSLLTVIGWKLEWWDLRPYIALQYGGLVLIAMILSLCPNGLISNQKIWNVLGLYSLAKIFELLDGPVYQLLQIVSGHTLKHFIAALAMIQLFKIYHGEQK